MKRKNKKNEITGIVHRIGDASEYHTVGELDALIDVLREADLGPAGTIHRREGRMAGGITSENYQGDNYISAYWCDRHGEYVKDLSRSEVAKIAAELGKDASKEIGTQGMFTVLPTIN